MVAPRDLIRMSRQSARNEKSDPAPCFAMMPQTIERQINDRRCEQCEHLAYDEAANDCDSKWPPQLRACAPAERQRDATQDRAAGRHHDWTESEKTGFIDRVS
jgi:hypothetical protein